MADQSSIFGALSRASALALWELALIARHDGEDVKRFYLDWLPIWESLDRELLHPTTEAPMPTTPRLRPYQPKSRAEAAAPLSAVEDACRSDPGYLASVVKIAADVLLEANSKTEPTVPGESTEARMLRMQRRVMSQVAHRSA